MKINSIFIQGFKNEKNKVELNFNKNDISVIYGLNGSGKTTLLRIIHAILDKNEEILINEKVDYIKLCITNNSGNEEIIEIKRITSLEIEEEEYFNRFDWHGFEQSSLTDATSILFGVNRGITNRDNVDIQTIYSFVLNSYRNLFKNVRMAMNFSNELSRYLNEQNMRVNHEEILKEKIEYSNISNLNVDYINMASVQNIIYKRYRLSKEVISARVQKALFDTLSSAINPEKNGFYNQKISSKEFKENYNYNRDLLLEALLDTDENQLRNQLVEVLRVNNADEIVKVCSSNFLLAMLIYKMIEELKNGGEVLESINNLEKIFNSHLEKDKELVISNKEVYIKAGEDKHSLNDLSSGERHLLTFLTLFLIEGNNKDFLLIDEPEISLNINWQRQILLLLKKLSPKAQIIVASHSPSIAKMTPSSLVKMEVNRLND